MSSQRRIDSSRANGAKSGGPTTPDGRARCQLAALAHGLASHRVVLENESEQDFQALRDAYLAEFQPETRLEMDFLDQLAAARWRLNRVWALEAALLDLETSRKQNDIHKELEACDPETQTAIAFKSLCDDSRALSLLSRYEARCRRTFERAIKTLTRLRKKRGSKSSPGSQSQKRTLPE